MLWIYLRTSFGFKVGHMRPNYENPGPESKTDTGHECGMYTWFVDLHIGKEDGHKLLDFCSSFDSAYGETSTSVIPGMKRKC